MVAVRDSAAEKPQLLGDAPPVVLLDWVGERIRVKHYSVQAKQADSDWIKRSVIFGGKARQSPLGAVGVDAAPNQVGCLIGRT